MLYQSFRRLWHCLDTIGAQVNQWLYPPQCLACHAPILSQGTLCEDCWTAMPWHHAPECEHCHYPLPDSAVFLPQCASCLAHPPYYDRAYYVAYYQGVARHVLMRMKFQDHPWIARIMAQWMAHQLPSLHDIDYIIPVPLDRRRLRKRKYNQAALLAQALGTLRTLPVVSNLLQRKKTPFLQHYLSRGQRWRHARHLFFVPPSHHATLQNKRILLVDDVMTTGATVNACSHALKKAGAQAVIVGCFARTLKHDIK